METIPRTQLAELMKRATTYDDWAIPLDSRLRQGLAVAGLGMVITMIIDFMQLGGNLLYSMSMGRFVVNLCGLVASLRWICVRGAMPSSGPRRLHRRWWKHSAPLLPALGFPGRRLCLPTGWRKPRWP